MLREIESIKCGDGWHGVVYSLCNKMAAKLPKVQFSEIKEKFGRLYAIPKIGTYTEIQKEEIWTILEFYSNLSVKVCEETGGSGSLRINKDGTLKTLCDQSAILLGYDSKP